jgi:formate hydrogenlyase subunit 6/NADH:ubiquinone oxidoreductase subunit I
MPQLPDLNETRCIGCRDCVAVCPTECLEMAGPLPWLPRPSDCVACNLCVVVCPTLALELVDLVSEHPQLS